MKVALMSESSARGSCGGVSRDKIMETRSEREKERGDNDDDEIYCNTTGRKRVRRMKTRAMM
jgi:hypothetical protein